MNERAIKLIEEFLINHREELRLFIAMVDEEFFD